MKNADAKDALFSITDHADFSDVRPTAYSGGPWNPDHQHGGAISALLTRMLDRMDAPVEMRLARITIDMFRGVPLTPLRAETRIVRGGRRIQSVEVNLFDGDVQVARATGLRVRKTDAVPELEALPPLDPTVGPAPEVVPDFEARTGVSAIPPFVRAVEIVPGVARVCGTAATTWTRLRCPVVKGEPTTPIVQLAALVDFASGTGNAMDYTTYSAINPDLSIHVLREPRSDWLALEGTTFRSGDGLGHSAAIVHDLEGPVGRIYATLLLDRQPTPRTSASPAKA